MVRVGGYWPASGGIVTLRSSWGPCNLGTHTEDGLLKCALTGRTSQLRQPVKQDYLRFSGVEMSETVIFPSYNRAQSAAQRSFLHLQFYHSKIQATASFHESKAASLDKHVI